MVFKMIHVKDSLPMGKVWSWDFPGILPLGAWSLVRQSKIADSGNITIFFSATCAARQDDDISQCFYTPGSTNIAGWKMDPPIENGDFPASYVTLLEGRCK